MIAKLKKLRRTWAIISYLGWMALVAGGLTVEVLALAFFGAWGLGGLVVLGVICAIGYVVIRDLEDLSK